MPVTAGFQRSEGGRCHQDIAQAIKAHAEHAPRIGPVVDRLHDRRALEDRRMESLERTTLLAGNVAPSAARILLIRRVVDFSRTSGKISTRPPSSSTSAASG